MGGINVHARSTHGAAINSLTGELSRVRFGAEPVVAWLRELPAPVRACRVPRASGDRVKTDRKDAELLARLLLAGQLKPVPVPPDWLEAIRHLARTREYVRRDLGRARHRVGKLLLLHGRVYPGAITWTARIGAGWPARASNTPRPSWCSSDQLAFIDGLIARRDALDERSVRRRS